MIMEQVDDKAVWDRFIDDSPDGTIFHKWDFLKIVEKYTGYRLYTFGMYRNDSLAGVIPFFLSRRGPLSMVYSPPQMPLANIPYLGFATSPEIDGMKQHDKILAWNDMIEAMHGGLKEIAPSYISIGLVSTIMDIRPFEWDKYEIDLQYTYVLDLDRPLAEIWEGFDRDCRKNINECAKYPLSMKESDDVDTFNEIMKNNLTKDGETFYHKRDPAYIKEILAAFPENIKMYFFYNGEEIVGVKINVGYKKHYLSWMGNVSMQKDLNINEFFYWEMIKKAKAAGYKRHENYGTFVPRLNIFKSKFNPSLEPCFYVQKKDRLQKVVEYGYEKVSSIMNKVK